MADFATSVTRIGLANVLSQAISFGAMPIITRLYAPESFGTFSMFLSAVFIVLPVATIRFNAALVLPSDPAEACHLSLLGMASTCITTLLTVIGLLVLVSATNPVINELDLWLWALPSTVLVHALGQLATGWATREAKFGATALSRVTESVTDRGIALALGLAGMTGVLGLVLGRTIGPGVAAAVMLLSTSSWREQIRSRAHNLKELRQTFHRYRSFAVYGTSAALVDVATREIPTILVAVWFSSYWTGMYALGLRVLSLPMLIVGDALTTVLYGRTVDARRTGVLTHTDISRLLAVLFQIGLAPIALLTAFGPVVFKFVFGAEWEPAGELVQILAVSYLAAFLHRPASVLFDVLEKQHERLAFDALLLVLRIGAIFIGHIENSITLAFSLLSFVTCLTYGAGMVYLLTLVGAKHDELRVWAVRRLIPAAVLFLCLGIAISLAVPWGLKGACIAAALAAHLVVAWRLDADLRIGVRPIINRLGAHTGQ